MAIQQGVHYGPGDRPPDHFRLMVINATPGIDATSLHAALTSLWSMLTELKDGVWRDLSDIRPGEDPVLVPGGNLSLLLGFGSRLFDGRVHKPAIVDRALLPTHELGWDLVENGTDVPFARLKWRKGVDIKQAQGDLCLQFLGDSELTVDRAVLETSELIRVGQLPLSISAVYRGFHREDRRSWIGFHDGINNMSRDERAQAIPALPNIDHPWTAGGTYMTFLKIAVDLAVWRNLSRAQQECVVGRDKLTGAPLDGASIVGGAAVPAKMQGCPFNRGMGPMPDQEPIECLTAGSTADPIVLNSHIHRTNLQRGDPQQDANNRIYRQGFEFLDTTAEGTIDVGLNFVSFARSNVFVETILSLNNWLGDANFGGSATRPEVTSPELMSLLAGGRYVVPKDAAPFPGAELLSSTSLTAGISPRRLGLKGWKSLARSG